MSRQRCHIAVVGSGFSGALVARVLAVLGYDVVLLERGTHPRFAIGESTTPLANLSLERLGIRYGLADCYHLAAYGRWLDHYPHLGRGLKRGFTFYRHHAGKSFAGDGLQNERLLVAASPNDSISDTHWLREDVDHHFVREAVAAGVDYRDRAELMGAEVTPCGVRLSGRRDDAVFALDTSFVIDASGPGGFLARQIGIPSGLDAMETSSGLVFSHFTGVRSLRDVAPDLQDGPYPDDWAAVHHLIDEGWMYSLRFDHGVTSAGLVLRTASLSQLGAAREPAELWSALLERYPTIAAVFAEAHPIIPIRRVSRMQHRLTRAAGARWALLPHTYAFVDPLFSTGIAWGLRAIERLALAFEPYAAVRSTPDAAELARYDLLLAREADQIDLMVAGAYQAMAHFDLFAAHAMLYFATVSFAEARQRLTREDAAAWDGFLGVGDHVLEPLARESLDRLRRLTSDTGSAAGEHERREYGAWVREAIAPRNVAGLADPARNNLYPVDLDALISRHALLGMTRDQIVAALPMLRGMEPDRVLAARSDAGRSTSPPAPRATAPQARAPR